MPACRLTLRLSLSILLLLLLMLVVVHAAVHGGAGLRQSTLRAVRRRLPPLQTVAPVACSTVVWMCGRQKEEGARLHCPMRRGMGMTTVRSSLLAVVLVGALCSLVLVVYTPCQRIISCRCC